MYTKNIAGPIEQIPGGTPDVTGRLSDSAPSTTTDCVLPLRKLLIHSSVVESMQYSCSDDMSNCYEQPYRKLWRNPSKSCLLSTVHRRMEIMRELGELSLAQHSSSEPVLVVHRYCLII